MGFGLREIPGTGHRRESAKMDEGKPRPGGRGQGAIWNRHAESAGDVPEHEAGAARMNREQKEHRLQIMYKGLSYADKLIWAHCVGTHVSGTRGIDDALPQMEAEAFETFYEESIGQWNDDGSFKYAGGSPGD